MGSENHHHPLHQFYHHKNLHIHHHRSTFLPMLCSRPSVKDVSLPRCRGRARSFNNDPPLSPRIGCTGQVKRHNKIAGLPISHRFSLTPKSNTTTTTTISTSPVVKLKRLFSGKSFSTTTTATAPPAASSCGARPQQPQPPVTVNSADVPRKHRCSRNENFVPISIENMDPPLPVIKKVRKPEEESRVDSLWKRRSGGAALRSLQLQQIHHPRHQLQVTSV